MFDTSPSEAVWMLNWEGVYPRMMFTVLHWNSLCNARVLLHMCNGRVQLCKVCGVCDNAHQVCGYDTKTHIERKVKCLGNTIFE